MKIIVSLLLLGLSGWTLSLPINETSKLPTNDPVVDEISNQVLPTQNQNASSHTPGVLIAGGVEAERKEFPWLVIIHIGDEICGGSLIELDLVLTAAHCVTDEQLPPSGNITVTAGDHNLRLVEGTEQTQIASTIIVHENYTDDNGRIENDIALIKLSERFNQTEYVGTVGLPSVSSEIGTSGIVAGWGSVFQGGDFSALLYKVEVPIVTDQSCTDQLTDSDSQFCAGSNTHDACQGDSGGPLICNNASKVVCGIVSYAESCRIEDQPRVYTKVLPYVMWIEQHLSPTPPTTLTPVPPTVTSSPTTGANVSSTAVPSSSTTLFVSIFLLFGSIFTSFSFPSIVSPVM